MKEPERITIIKQCKACGEIHKHDPPKNWTSALAKHAEKCRSCGGGLSKPFEAKL